jgi:hypothetical protein
MSTGYAGSSISITGAVHARSALSMSKPFVLISIERNGAASTQNQAESALLFLYKEVLGRAAQRIGKRIV